MASVSTYLNFADQTEEAFLFYQTVFGGEFIGGISRFGDMPPAEGMPPLPETDKNLIMHMALPIIGGHVLMGSDAPKSLGFQVNHGNNVHINLELDSSLESDRIFNLLSDGGNIIMPLQDMFWGDYFGTFSDKFGVHWMINCSTK